MPDDLVGLHEAAQRAGVAEITIKKWAARHLDFPEPVAVLKAGRIWEWADIERWLQVTGRLERDND